MPVYQCTNCHQMYPEIGVPYRCSRCTGIFDLVGTIPYSIDAIEPINPGIWRYRSTFCLPDDAPIISLGEGNTPLVWTKYRGRNVAVKTEFQNPSGSFKDRGYAVVTSFLVQRGIQTAIEDSSGNAGASFAAYAARAGIQARVFIPDSASGPKRQQISKYGANVVCIMGPRSNATEAARRAFDQVGGDQPAAYASHAYLPFNLAGYATAAYELAEQLGGSPGAVVLPVGQGGLLLGMARGFQAMMEAGLIMRLPLMLGVQARACAPLWALQLYGPAGLSWVAEADTVAEGIRVKQPLRGDAIMELVRKGDTAFLAVDEEEIIQARDELARSGFYVEPTSAAAWAALAQPEDLPEPVVIMLTGSGLKSAQ